MHPLLLTLLLLATPAFAAPGDPDDGVEVSKQQYYAKFKDLPPSRKCEPKDAVGVWEEHHAFESPGSIERSAREKEGKKYLAFGEYNKIVITRALAPIDVSAAMETTKQQYIATAAGMLYTYSNNTPESSLICLISTEPLKQHPAGLLMLALPIEKDKPLVITLFAPQAK